METNEFIGAVGGIAGVAAVAGFIGKLVADKAADAALKRFDSSLKRAEEVHRHTLGRIEEEQKSVLRRAEELQRSAAAFSLEIDTDLRARRIPIYTELWEKTGLLPMWPWNTKLTYENIHKLTGDLRDWYFKRGGMYLSARARNAYFEVQIAINAITETDDSKLVSEGDYNAIRTKCSALRTELTEDLLTRREAPLAGSKPDG